MTTGLLDRCQCQNQTGGKRCRHKATTVVRTVTLLGKDPLGIWVCPKHELAIQREWHSTYPQADTDHYQRTEGRKVAR